MKGPSFPPRAGLRIAVILALATSIYAHSWVEYAYKIAPNGTLVGDVGYARGYMPRNESGWKDAIPQCLLPASGQSAYTGDEILNKYPFDANPEFPMLEAAAGDHIAIMHLENGHTTLPFNQPHKPHNRGTIFFYGTSTPDPKERLFDVHLLWNRNGDGGNGRGRLLATRNYDDGRCYQPNNGELNRQRADAHQGQGAVIDQELACQSDIRLPDDLKPGSVYTIYWYWDWPDLDDDLIDMDATKNGLFPWAGSFMRHDKNPHNFKMQAITRNESYSSVLDIKISAKGSGAAAFSEKGKSGNSWVADQNIYSMGILDQMKNNFQVDIDAPGSDDNKETPAAPTSAHGNPDNHDDCETVIVTKTITVAPTVTKTQLITDATQLTQSTDDGLGTAIVTMTKYV